MKVYPATAAFYTHELVKSSGFDWLFKTDTLVNTDVASKLKLQATKGWKQAFINYKLFSQNVLLLYMYVQPAVDDIPIE
jgi:hypothetical protein